MQLRAACEMAAKCRNAGVLEVTISGMHLVLAPREPEKVKVDSDDDQDNNHSQDPMADPATFARADGSVPGFAKLRK